MIKNFSKMQNDFNSAGNGVLPVASELSDNVLEVWEYRSDYMFMQVLRPVLR
jgi:hypothetical protein